jgi:hypothetical protein
VTSEEVRKKLIAVKLRTAFVRFVLLTKQCRIFQFFLVKAYFQQYVQNMQKNMQNMQNIGMKYQCAEYALPLCRCFNVWKSFEIPHYRQGQPQLNLQKVVQSTASDENKHHTCHLGSGQRLVNYFKLVIGA